jgi:hypothetical protein
MNATQMSRAVVMMQEFAGEEVSVEKIGTATYVFGSELACLRIFAKYQTNGAIHNSKARVGFSKEFASWYFSLETSY